MPPKKKTVEQTQSTTDIEVVSDEEIAPVSKFEMKSKPMIITSNSSDNDRIKLANAINNLTIKSEEFMNAMNSFDSFREKIAKIDIELETKKQEFNELVATIDSKQKLRMVEIEEEFSQKQKELVNKYNEMTKEQNQKYVDMTKALVDKYQDLNKKLDNEYQDKNKKLETEYQDTMQSYSNEMKNKEIKVKQMISEFKTNACSDYAKENNMILIKQEDYNTINAAKQKVQQEFDELKKSFDTQCNTIRKEVQSKYDFELKHEKERLDLTHKVNNAELKAQVEQHKKEVVVLQNTIDNLKNELAENRALTKEITNQVAQSATKSQISQTFMNDKKN